MPALQRRASDWRGVDSDGVRGWRVGRWRIDLPHDPGGDARIVFPIVPVAVSRAGRAEGLANAHHAVLQNPGEGIGLRPLGSWTDVGAVIAVDAAWLAGRGADPARPFDDGARLRLPPDVFLAQRGLDPLAPTDAIAAVVSATLTRGAPAAPASRAIVRHAERVLSTRFTEPLELADVAGLVGCSPWHLARVFRAEIGTSVHRYRDQLRMRAAVDRLRAPGVDLTELALELGYASHSHFTDRFRAAFGVPPSAVRG